MQFAEKGTRIDDLKAIIERVTSVTTLFDRCAPGILTCTSPVCEDILSKYCLQAVLRVSMLERTTVQRYTLYGKAQASPA